MAVDKKPFYLVQHITFWSKTILNERQQRICVKMQSAQMVKYGVFVAYLVLCLKGWETGLVSLAKLNIDIKDGITLLIESCSISTSFHLI